MLARTLYTLLPTYKLTVLIITTGGHKRIDGSSLAVCVGKEFELLPTTLNSRRFLHSTPSINYQSNNFLVPPGRDILLVHDVIVSVKEDSILRVYTEHHTTVDIDLKLFRIDEASGKDVLVATATNGFFQEEVGYSLSLVGGGGKGVNNSY